MSVGTLHSIPSSSHMRRILPELRAAFALAACRCAEVQWRFPSNVDRREGSNASRHAPTAIAILLLIGCGSAVEGRRRRRHRRQPDAGGTGGGGLGGTGLGGGGGAGGGMAGAAIPTGSLVFQGTEAALLDLGAPCTNEEGATGDRWCAFIAPSAGHPTSAALFVVNVSKAAAGTSITCGATDANCLKLTDTLRRGPTIHPRCSGATRWSTTTT